MSGSPSPTGTGPARAVTVLIVEDDAGAADVFKQILTMNGFRVVVAPDAERGLVELQRVRPSALLLDLHLPMAGGVEFLRQLRPAAAPADGDVPIAVVTGDYFIEEAVTQELQTLGAQVHFKPLWEDDLLRLVHGLLDGREARSQGDTGPH